MDLDSRCRRGGGNRLVTETGVWDHLLSDHICPDRSSRLSKARSHWQGSPGDSAWNHRLRRRHSVDDLHPRRRFHYSRKYSELAYVLFHEDLWQTLARSERLRPERNLADRSADPIALSRRSCARTVLSFEVVEAFGSEIDPVAINTLGGINCRLLLYGF